MTVRIFGNECKDQVYDILVNKEGIGAYKSLQVNEHVMASYNNLYFSKNPNYLIFGKFNKNELMAYICVIFTVVKGHPAWCISMMSIKHQQTTFSWKFEGLQDIVKSIFDVVEHRGYRRYYYMISKRLHKIYYKKWTTNSDIFTSPKYKTNIEAEIPENTTPINQFHWNLMGRKVKKESVLVLERIMLDDIKLQENYYPHPLEYDCLHKNWDEIYKI